MAAPENDPGSTAAESNPPSSDGGAAPSSVHLSTTVSNPKLVANENPNWPELPGYEIVEEIGGGGMGMVYKARQLDLNRTVAVKVIRKEFLSHDQSFARFRREMEVAARLLHPNIVTVFHASVAGDTPFFAMEYVNGVDLRRLLEKAGPLPVDQASDYIRQAATGLQHAFERGLVHRDIKPANLVVAHDASGDRLKILDLGLARPLHSDDLSSAVANANPTSPGILMGTVDYMAPEQAEDATQVDIRADLYSLGCTFYHLLTGRTPFRGRTTLERLDGHRFKSPQPIEQLRPDVSAAIAAIIHRLLEKRPANRFQTPQDLVNALSGEALHEPNRERRAHVGVNFEQEFQGELARLEGHDDRVICLALSPDERFVASGSLDRSARIWDIETAKERRRLSGHDGPVSALAFAPDGSLLATGERRRSPSVRLWDLRTGVERRRFTSAAEAILDLCFLQEGRQLAIASDDHSVSVWAVDTGNQVAFYQWKEGSATSALLDSRLGLGLFAGLDGSFVLGDLRNGKAMQLRVGRFGVGRCAGFVPDGRHVVLAADRRIIVLDCETSARVAGWNGDRESAIALAVSSEGTRVLAGGVERRLRLWDLQRGSEIASFKGHTDKINAVAMASNGKLAISASDDRTVRFWAIPRENIDREQHSVTFVSPATADHQGPMHVASFLQHVGKVDSVRFAHDASQVVSCGIDHTIRIWNSVTTEETSRLLGHTDRVWAAKFLAGRSQIISASQDGTVRLWDARSGVELRRVVSLDCAINDVAVFEGMGCLLTASDDYLVRLWDFSTGKEVRSLAGHSGEVLGVIFGKNPKYAISCGEDGAVKLWDLESGKDVRRFGTGLFPRRHRDSVCSVDISFGWKEVLTASHDGVVRLWDYESGKEKRVFRDNHGKKHCAMFIGNGDRILVASGYSLVIWDAITGREEMRLQPLPSSAVLWVAVTPDGETAASAHEDGAVRLWRIQ